jgi:SAM-dependent methyltransferase
MPEIASTDYHDYVIKDGRFIGEFEQMYRNVPDPWHCVQEAHSFKNDLLLGAVTHVKGDVRRALDLGCGLGALTVRLQAAAPDAEWHACDVSPSALDRARAAAPGVRFFVQDLARVGELPFAPCSLDLVTMAEVMWYILPHLPSVLARLHDVLGPGGHLLVLQYFLRPEDQRYGKEFVAGPDDLLRLVRAAGFQVAHEVYLSARPPQGLLLAAMKPGSKQP